MTTLIPRLLKRLGCSASLLAHWDRDPAAAVILNVPVDLSTDKGRKLARLLMGGLP